MTETPREPRCPRCDGNTDDGTFGYTCTCQEHCGKVGCAGGLRSASLGDTETEGATMNDPLHDRLMRASSAVYLATDEAVARDLSGLLKEAAGAYDRGVADERARCLGVIEALIEADNRYWESSGLRGPSTNASAWRSAADAIESSESVSASPGVTP